MSRTIDSNSESASGAVQANAEKIGLSPFATLEPKGAAHNGTNAAVKPLRGRFAPSPTGEIHAGTIFAALQAWLIAKSTGGSMVLRIEDLDPERSKRSYADAIMRDFEALGLTWDEGPHFQHDRQEAYLCAFERLCASSEIYPCFCTRADLRAAGAPHLGERLIYNRRCLQMAPDEIACKRAALSEEGRDAAFRVWVPDGVDGCVSFDDIYQGVQKSLLSEDCGDFILRRSDGGFAYQLAVVVDDAEQGIDCVTRGYDLLSSTPQQIFLQQKLGLKTPVYAHFPLFCAADGRRLAKRNKDASLHALCDAYGSHEAVLGHIAYIGGLQSEDEPTTPQQLLKGFDASDLAELYRNRISIEFS